MRLILGIGTNIGDKKCNIENAIGKITFLENCKVSSLIETPALLSEDAPKEWNLSFLNGALSGDCLLTPQEVIVRIKQIELELGRDPNHKRWSPRVIDIDILLYGDLVYNENGLTIPHAQFFNRSFALIPAMEIESEMVNKMWEKLNLLP